MPLLPLLLLSLACKPEPTEQVHVDPVDAETEWVFDIEVRQDPEMPTLVSVAFSSAEAGNGWVTFGGVDGAEQETPQGDAGTRHEIMVLGLPALTEVPARACVMIEASEHCSSPFFIESGNLEPDTPELTVTVDEYSQTAPLQSTLLMSVFNFTATGHIVMVDLSGQVFWVRAQGEMPLLGNSVVPHMGNIAYNVYEPQSSIGRVEEVSLENDLLGVTDTPGAHHFFDYHPGGGLCWLAPETRNIEGKNIVGDMILCRSEDGETWRMSSVWEHLSYVPDPTLPEMDFIDWSHANWLHYSKLRRTFLTSFAFLDTVMEVAPDGRTLAVFSGSPRSLPIREGDFYTLAPGEPEFYFPHGAHWASNGDLLMFVADEDNIVRAARYALDEETLTMRQVWSYSDHNVHSLTVLGEVQELADGNILISWGGAGIVQIVSPEGEVLWELLTDFGEIPSQIHLIPTPYME